MPALNSTRPTSAILISTLSLAIFGGCAHQLGPRKESMRVARDLGLPDCTVTEPMRRYQTLDYADLIGNRNMAD